MTSKADEDVARRTADVSALVAELREAAFQYAEGQQDIAEQTAEWRAADALTALQARAEKAEAGMAALRDAANNILPLSVVPIEGTGIENDEADTRLAKLGAVLASLPAASEAAARVIADAVEWHEAVQYWTYLTAVEKKLSQSVAALLKAREEQR